MKECILTAPIATTEDISDDLFGSGPETPIEVTESAYTPILLLLVQPLALKALKSAVSSVSRWKDHLSGLSASGESAKIAKDVLVSLVDESAIVDIKALEEMLAEFLVTAEKSTAEGE